MRFKACYSGWIWFDALLVCLGVLDVVSRNLGGLDFGVNPSVLRLARVARILRLTKILKSRRAFHSLFLLLKSIYASVNALVWSFLTLFFIMLAAGMLLNQMLHNVMSDDS